VTIDWPSLLVISTDEIVRTQMIPDDAGAGVLWSVNPQEVLELSAVEVMAWEGHRDKPDGPRFEWAGFNLLCNAAPTSFVLDGERFLSLDSFHEALKFPEDTPGRADCALAPSVEARRLARRRRQATFTYRGQVIRVHSADHEGLLAAAISAKVAQNPAVQDALRETKMAKLIFPLSFSNQPGALARATPLSLMIERWKSRMSASDVRITKT
jgi:hypothetical protein